MSNLPLEMYNNIKADAEHYANIQIGAKDKISVLALIDQWDDTFNDYKAGATEWAEKAQGPISTLELLSVWLNECKEYGKLLDVDKAISVIEDALSKYKEVSNG